MISIATMRDLPSEILAMLTNDNPVGLEALLRQADGERRCQVGDEVHLRGILEIANVCARRCQYCGMHAGRKALVRYRMPEDEILDLCIELSAAGFGTVVLQSGEDPGISCDSIVKLITKIKLATSLAITLSLGERSREDLQAWKQAGADRYLMKFETSSPELFNRIHPSPGGWHARLRQLALLRELGFETGTGMMIGVPGSTYGDLVRDLLLLKDLQPDMIGIGPFIAHPDTPLGEELSRGGKPHEGIRQTVKGTASKAGRQVPADDNTTLKAMAIARLLCPTANITVTTALQTISPEEGLAAGICSGANVIMPNFTPIKYRQLYDLYPRPQSAEKSSAETFQELKDFLESQNRRPGSGAGTSIGFLNRINPRNVEAC